MNDGDEYLQKRVIAKTGPGELVGEGKVVAYSNNPMVLIKTDSWTKFWWSADLCQFVDEKDGEVKS